MVIGNFGNVRLGAIFRGEAELLQLPITNFQLPMANFP
jgi:hypothetical protein